MRFIVAAIFVLVTPQAGPLAASTSNAPDARIPEAHQVDIPDGREGGEDIATAIPIPTLPFSDTGSTCGHRDDYDAVCPYSGSTAPDVVYSLTVGTDKAITITVDLCSSHYDTKVYVFRDAANQIVACNDDAGCGYSGWQSKIERAPLAAGHTYYIVVDGYGDDCGDYVVCVTEWECALECWPGGMQEGEPDCHDGYVDTYNGGCDSSPHVFQSIPPWPPPPPGAAIVMCGKSGTYVRNGLDCRDTDWFQLDVPMTQSIMVDAIAEFPLDLRFVYGADCDDLQYLSGSAPICESAVLGRTIHGGHIAWIVVAPQAYTSVACGADYVLEVYGYGYWSPVESTSWGAIKALYR